MMMVMMNKSMIVLTIIIIISTVIRLPSYSWFEILATGRVMNLRYESAPANVCTPPFDT